MRRRAPNLVVCAGGGGVGKTTVAAAMALASARAGVTTLVVTVDPARRLADALGTTIGSEVGRVDVDPAAAGRLYALMPDPKSAVRICLDHFIEGERAAHDRVASNALYLALEDAIAGVHELMSVVLISRAAETLPLERVIVDTAPSRHALDFVTYPGRLASLLEGRAMKWLGSLATHAAAPPGPRGLVAWGRRRIDRIVASTLGPRVIGDFASIFADLSIVRKRFTQVTRDAEALLLGPSSRFVLVGAPTAAARADIQHLARRVHDLGRDASAIVLNRADTGPPGWVASVRASDPRADLAAAVEILETERAARTLAADETAAAFRKRWPGMTQVRLPMIASDDPATIVGRLADAIAPSLDDLVGA